MTASATVLIAAGGTGGHIFPALAVAGELHRRGYQVHWLGSRQGPEGEQAAAAGIGFSAMAVSSLRGRWRGPGAVLMLLKALWQALRVLRRVRPACVLGLGGYPAGPGGLAARLLRCPLLVHEQNAIPGLTNRVLARLAVSVMEGVPGAFPKLGTRFTGNPVREEICRLPPPAERLANRDGPLRLLVLGGSQGARALNQSLPPVLAALPSAQRPDILHQAGRDNQQEVAEAYRRAGLSAQVRDFIQDMAGGYAWADLAVCRAGALTLAELAAAGLGAVLVPLPTAADNHQEANARGVEAAGAALLLPEHELAAGLLGILQELCADRPRLARMAAAARQAAVPAAAARVADECERVIHERHAA